MLESLTFTGPDQGWPPRPSGMRDPRPVESIPLPGLLTLEVADEMRAAAARSEKVRRLLGERFTHISTNQVFHKKRRPTAGHAPDVVTLFYSYTNNHAVEVHMIGREIRRARAIKGYQPAEGIDEVEQAIDLARDDARIHDHVSKLSADAILMPQQAGSHGYGNRLLWVTFSEPDEEHGEKPVRYCAVVDLTDRKVVLARPEEPISE